ncbi:hypothetical protein E2986_03950 [Frieseomelitta varia]|uniref:Alpha-and gamma-adaptin-binding protein p34 n=1 Tax=Frieseomelitta varia TaxID=561572 RepID=A0A833RU83_9HYME|nr:hypothetical protein E2986_03950 [Frieseomelitta varia]
MNLPRILIISTEEGKANEIAMNIGGEKLSNQDHFEYHLWNIQNKYYKTQVLICVTENPSQDIPVDDIEALIVHHDPQAILLLGTKVHASNNCHIKLWNIKHVLMIKWCLQNKFELIELNRPDVDASEADSENNKYGIERIIEALHAHMWPNMILKGKSSNVEEQIPDMNEVEEQFENIELSRDSTETLPVENMLDGIMGEENADFGELFSQLRAMKEHAAMLPTNQRRIAAEQLVTAFWKAMGGDPSEMED